MECVRIAPPHGILFLLDPKNTAAIIPEYVPGQVLAFTDTCVSVATQAAVDGDIDVFMGSDTTATDDLIQVGQLQISVPNGQIALMTSDTDPLFHFAVPAERVTVTIWVDTVDGPTRLIVRLNGSF